MESLRQLLERAGHRDIFAADDAAPATPAPDDDFWYSDRPGGGRSLGVRVNEYNALGFVTVFACIRVVSETLGSAVCQVFEQQGSNKRLAPQHEVYDLVHLSPDGQTTAVEYWTNKAAHVVSWGNGYSQIVMDPRRRIQALRLLRPDWMEVKRDDSTGLIFYVYRQPGREPQTYMADEIFHVPGLGFDGVKGYSVISQLARTIGVGMAAEEYGGRFFENNAMPGGYIKHPGSLSPKAKKNLREEWDSLQRGLAGSHKMGILDEGMSIESVGIPAKDAQLIELRGMQRSDICAGFRVQPHKIGDLSRSTNNNIEHQAIEFVTDCIRPLAVRFEKRADLSLFGPREPFFMRFDLSSLLRGDSAAQSAYFREMRNIGVYNADDIRQKLGEDPIGEENGGTAYLVNGAMISMRAAATAGPPNPTTGA